MLARIAIFAFAAILPAVSVSGVASAKPGPPGSLAEGHIQADMGRHPCLTATSTSPGHRVTVQPCTTQLNALQRWKVLKVFDVVVVGLAGHPGTCLGAVPEKVKQQRRTLYLAQTYDCGQQITAEEGLHLVRVGGPYYAIAQTHGGKWLSAAHKQGGISRYALWLPPSGNIPYTQVWIFPPFKRITP